MIVMLSALRETSVFPAWRIARTALFPHPARRPVRPIATFRLWTTVRLVWTT